MRYLISLLVGMAVGVAAFVALLYYNPLTSQNKLSPLSVSANDVFTLNYSAVATDALVYTNDGESLVAPYPAKVLQLWEPSVRLTDTMATVLRDSRNQLAGIGIKFSSDSESTNVLNAEAIVDSVWHIYLPGKGTLFVAQQEKPKGVLAQQGGEFLDGHVRHDDPFLLGVLRFDGPVRRRSGLLISLPLRESNLVALEIGFVLTHLLSELVPLEFEQLDQWPCHEAQDHRLDRAGLADERRP